MYIDERTMLAVIRRPAKVIHKIDQRLSAYAVLFTAISVQLLK